MKILKIMRIFITIIAIVFAFLITIFVLIGYYAPASPSKLNAECIISTIEDSDSHLHLWEKENSYVCGVKASEWGDGLFNKMHDLLSKKITILENSLDHSDVSNTIKIKRLSTGLSEIPQIKEIVAEHQPGWFTIILVGIFWLLFIFVKVSSMFPTNIAEDDASNSSSRDKKFGLYSADRKLCATCLYWSGNREINSHGNQFKVEVKDALCQVSKMTRDPITNRTRGASPKNTAPNFGLNCKYHKHLT